MANTNMTREEKKAARIKAKADRLKAYSKNTSAEQLEKTYKLYTKVVIVFIVFFVLSALFRPWFYSIIIAIITVREYGRKKDANIAYYLKTGEWLKEPKNPEKYMK